MCDAVQSVAVSWPADMVPRKRTAAPPNPTPLVDLAGRLQLLKPEGLLLNSPTKVLTCVHLET